MTWIAVKTFFKKCWTWLKHNWKAPLIIVYTIVLWLIFRRKGDAMKVLETRTESYKNQIDAINKIHDEEVKKKDKILENYGKILADIEEKYKKESLQLDKEKKKEIKDLVKKYDERPDELARLLAEKYGLDYVE